MVINDGVGGHAANLAEGVADGLVTAKIAQNGRDDNLFSDLVVAFPLVRNLYDFCAELVAYDGGIDITVVGNALVIAALLGCALLFGGLFLSWWRV